MPVLIAPPHHAIKPLDCVLVQVQFTSNVFCVFVACQGRFSVCAAVDVMGTFNSLCSAVH